MNQTFQQFFITENLQQIQTPEFKKWFEGSKVVDAEGRPLRVYHSSTKQGFNIFNTQVTGSHFGSAAQAEKKFNHDIINRKIDAREDWRLSDELTGATYPVYLRITKPYRVTDFEANSYNALWEKIVVKDRIFSDTIIEDGEPFVSRLGKLKNNNLKQPKNIFELFSLLKRFGGYDGLVYENTYEGAGDSYVVFEPNQIKSATGNRGTFNPKISDIRESYKITKDSLPANIVSKYPGHEIEWLPGNNGGTYRLPFYLSCSFNLLTKHNKRFNFSDSFPYMSPTDVKLFQQAYVDQSMYYIEWGVYNHKTGATTSGPDPNNRPIKFVDVTRFLNYCINDFKKRHPQMKHLVFCTGASRHKLRRIYEKIVRNSDYKDAVTFRRVIGPTDYIHIITFK